ncbi:MAG: hypothetical protein LBR10_03985 [Prevotellaceae bacterium]|jgi:hypothetical protein|nr:hypothetical protein [Prevotellaceae bacterium]
MNRKLVFTVAVLFATLSTNAQTSYLTVGDNIRLPEDSIDRLQLVANLNDFLIAIQHGNTEKWVLPSEKAETELLIDEMKGMDKKDSMTFKPYLINVEALADIKAYSVQVSYMGINKGAPLLRAVFELVAHRTDDRFLFSSPLVRNTRNWKTKTIEYMTFYYQDVAMENTIDKYAKAVMEYDLKFNNTETTKGIYFCNDCDDITCILRLTGIIYDLAANGIDWNAIDFKVRDKVIKFYTQRHSHREFDPHKLFHAAADNTISPEKRNHYMICGYAYIYAGEFCINWENIQKLFKTRMKYDKKTDWLKLYFDRYNFGESNEKFLLTMQFINALILQKVEKEQGFQSVMELLASGSPYRDEENFFKILEKVTGINKKNFNKEVGKLLQEAKL